MTDNDPHQPPPYVPGPNPGRPDEQPPQQAQPQQYGRPQPAQYQPQGQVQPWQPMGQPMPYPQMQPAPMIKPKNPGAAAVLSFLVPGVGQLLNGDIWLGIGMMILTVLAWLSLFIVIGFILLPAVYIWSIVEAYNTAKRWNTAHGIIS
jgi:TM2 domain-containing membrane protein YozV